MNRFLPAPFAERIERLMLGIEPIDALRATRIATPVDLVLDGPPSAAAPAADAQTYWLRLFGLPDATGGLRRIPRHNSCRHALLYRPGMKSPIAIRLFDRERRYAPRRISYPVPADIAVAMPRVRRPALFPGAAYDVSEASTGLRGRVTWRQSPHGEEPVRWVRVEATVAGQVVGRAHGDERGEFLLLLDCAAAGLGDLPSPLTAQVTVFGPAVPPPLPSDDPLGDLPLETLLADPDDISPGELLPAGYAATALSSRPVDFELGRLLSRQDKFFFNP
jgi:hypothetical protein